MKQPQELKQALQYEAKKKDDAKSPLGPKTMQDVAGTLAAMLDDDSRHLVQEYLTGNESLTEATPGMVSALFSWLRPAYDSDEKRYKPTNADAIAEVRAVLAAAQPVPIDVVGEEVLVEAAMQNGDSAIHLLLEEYEDMGTQTQEQVQPTVTHNEAKVVIFSDVHVMGWILHVTAREGATEEMILDTGRALVGALQKMQRKPEAQHEAPPPVQNGAVTMQAVAAPAPLPMPQSQPASNGGDVKTGTGALEQITVNPDGKIDFKVGGLKYPLKDSRGPEVVAGLFAPETGITAAHLAQPAIYTSAQLGVLFADWAKPGKYYDVVRIHR